MPQNYRTGDVWELAQQFEKDYFVRHFTSSAFNSKILLFASSTAASNHEIAMGMMDAIDRHKAERGLSDVTRHEILACTRHLNSIGAVRMIDTLGREAIGEICHKVLEAESHIL